MENVLHSRGLGGEGVTRNTNCCGGAPAKRWWPVAGSDAWDCSRSCRAEATRRRGSHNWTFQDWDVTNRKSRESRIQGEQVCVSLCSTSYA